MADATFRITAQNDTAAAFREIARQGTDLGDQLHAAFTAAFAGISAAGVWEGIKGAIEYGDVISKAAEKSGIAVEQFSALAFAAKQTDIDVGSLSRAIKSMQVAISDGSDKFAEIGIPLEKLRDLKPDVQIEAIAEAISRIQDPADRTAASVKIFGKAGADLLPLLEQGAIGVDKLTQEARDLGVTLDDLSAKQLKDAHDAMEKLGASWDALGRSAAVVASGKLSQSFDGLRKALGGETELEKLNEQLHEFAGQLKGIQAITAAGLYTPAQGNTLLLEVGRQIDEVQTKIASLSGGSGNATLAASIVGTPQQGAQAVSLAFKSIEAQLRVSMEHLRATMSEVTANGKWLEDLKKTIDTEQDLTETSLEKQLDSWDKFYAALNDLRARGVIDDAEYWNRLQARTDDVLQEVVLKSKVVVQSHKKNFDLMQQYGNEAAQGLEQGFANFLFDPFHDGLKGLVIDFANTIRQMLAQAAAAQIFKSLFGSGDANGSGLGNILGGLLGAFTGGGGAVGAGAGASAAMEDLAFANGGAFTVGGQGGTDSQLVRFKATPGERVNVTRPGDAGGVTYAPVYNIDARGATTDLVAALPGILQRHGDNVKSDLLEGLRKRKYRV